jgi:pimeloyl-ACP methyl ester carboxylesterase
MAPAPALLTMRGRCTRLSSPVVFLPGLMCTSRLWAHVMGALVDRSAAAASRQALFLPAGGSEGAPVFSANPHYSDSLATTATALLASLPPGRVSVVGHSLGGYLAMEMLRQAAPGRIGRLALVSTQPRADSPAIQQRRRDLMTKVRLSGPLAALSPPAVLLGEAQRGDGTMWSVVQGMANDVGAGGFASGCTAAMTRADSRDTLAALAADATPVLLLVGAEDAITPVAATKDMGRLIAHAELAVVEGCGHMAPLERPEPVTSALVEFLT